MSAIDPRASVSCSPAIPSRSSWRPWTSIWLWRRLRDLAAGLTAGALRELDLTPKPGLVDRHDNGSHPDLTYARMRASVHLLPAYYADLLAQLRAGRPLRSCVEAGRRAEARMVARVDTNCHRGYIFLSGLALVGAYRAQCDIRRLSGAVADAAREFFRIVPAEDSHGSQVRRAFAVGGIRREAEAGLPAVFDAAWPRYASSLRQAGDRRRAAYHAMAALMQRVEDTTALHRCGFAGLTRLRTDGQALQALLDCGNDPRAFLEQSNDEYRQLALTMGGVADCLALTFALEDCFVEDTSELSFPRKESITI